jgi:putative ABC transport system permease protein
MTGSRKAGDGGRPSRRRGVAEDVDREIRAHLELCTEELVREGWNPEAARAEAARRFGDERRIRRRCTDIEDRQVRKVRVVQMIEGMLQDLKFGVRALKNSPGFASVAIATLALGIAANATVFSVVNGVLLRPLPYHNPDELVSVAERSQSGRPMAVPWANFRDWSAENRSFSAITAYGAYPTTVLSDAEPVYTPVATVSRDFWRVFPVSQVAGRLTVPQDHVEGAAPVVVVSEMFASRYLGGHEAVGKRVEISGMLLEVVGIVPSDVTFPRGTELWVPAELTPKSESRSSHNWSVVGRLNEGITPAAAEREMTPLTVRLVATALAEEGPDYIATGTIIESLHETMVGDTRRPLLLLMGAAAFVLLVACTNLASTLLARGTTRARELAVRSALGASRGRIVRQLLSEATLLSLLGGAVGVGLTVTALGVIRAGGGGWIPRIEKITVDGTVLLFTLCVTLLTALAFGLLPALRARDQDEARVLRSEGRGNEGYKGHIWSILVATEVALALVLLIGSGLLIRSFAAVLAVNAGFDDRDVVVSGVALSQIKYPELDDHRRLWETMLQRVAAIPGVSGAGVITSLPAAGSLPNGRVHLDGDMSKTGDAGYVVASEGAFAALDIPLLQGRLFDASDRPESRHVVVVNQAFADMYWPGESAIGKQVSGGGMDNFWSTTPPVFGIVVGVVGNVRHRNLTRESRPTVYWNYRQRPFRLRWGANLVLESASGDPSGLAESLRETISEVDPDIAPRIQFLSTLVAGTLGERRFTLMVMSGFGILGLLLAALGVFGVVSYSVAQRNREIGIRLALGATVGAVRAMVLRSAMVPVVFGLLIGVAAAWGFSRALTGVLYEVRPTDPATFMAVSGLLLGTSLVACWLPAVRGTRLDPMSTMREE